ncbi:MAG: sugar transferase [Deltaproteobacteria bacterium]|nr:sugar transferase [Deltaproteobacteria bacterium]
MLDRWETPLDPRRIRAWRRRLLYKRIVWRLTFGLASSVKRALDVLGSACAILTFSPIFLASALLVKLEDGGPITFRQTRIGRGGRPFKMLKFRSMVPNAEAIKAKIMADNKHGTEGVTFKMADDPRVTRVGRVLRKYSIDEFPQFFNVFFGEMSLVGPRPSLPQEVTRYKAWQLRRLKVKPGITCLWQIGGRSDIDFEGQVRLDLEYIASESLWTDLKILLKTVPAVISGRGAY